MDFELDESHSLILKMLHLKEELDDIQKKLYDCRRVIKIELT